MITLKDIINWILIVTLSAFFGAPLLMMAVRWWQSVLHLASMRLL